MFLAKSFVAAAARQPSLASSLASSFRSLCITPQLLQQHKPSLTETNVRTNEQENRISPTERKECQRVFENVNKLVASQEQGRLFAVVHLCGKQFKVTPGDIILVEGYWPPTIGDEIRLEKVLLAGANDFTLIGTPMLEAGLVNVTATIVEKTLTHTKTHFKKKRRKQYLRINFQRSPNTMIRINNIEISGKVNDSASATNSKRLF